MEWISLIDWHLEVCLELIKSCYLREKKRESDYYRTTFQTTLLPKALCDKPPGLLRSYLNGQGTSKQERSPVTLSQLSVPEQVL